MQYNSGNDDSICDEINDICQSDNNSYPIKTKTRRVNDALDRFFTLAFQADGRWSFDDANQTSAPIEAIDITVNVQRYDLDSFASELHKVLRWELLDNNGNNYLLKRLDRSKVEGALTEYKSVASIPDEYDLVGNYIDLYSAPNFSSTGGLKAYFNRPASKFVYTDTTKEPGIPSMFHMYLARKAALPYLVEFQKGQRGDVASQIQSDERDILDYFSNRERIPRRMAGGYQNNK